MKLVEIIYNVVWGVAAMMLLAPSRHQTKNTKVTNSTDDLSVSARTDVGKIDLYERSRMFSLVWNIGLRSAVLQRRKNN
jgi:hypothetical protein